MRALGFGFRNELANVPAKGMDQFLGAVRHREYLSIVADARQVSARGRLVRNSAIVVAKLDQNVVAGLHVCQEFVPQTLLEIGSGATAGAGTVFHVYSGCVEVAGKGIAPTLTIGIARRGIAGDKNSRLLRQGCARQHECDPKVSHETSQLTSPAAPLYLQKTGRKRKARSSALW